MERIQYKSLIVINVWRKVFSGSVGVVLVTFNLGYVGDLGPNVRCPDGYFILTCPILRRTYSL